MRKSINYTNRIGLPGSSNWFGRFLQKHKHKWKKWRHARAILRNLEKNYWNKNFIHFVVRWKDTTERCLLSWWRMFALSWGLPSYPTGWLV